MKPTERPWSKDAAKLLQHMHDYARKVDMEDDAQINEIVNLGINLLMWHTFAKVNNAKGRLTEKDYDVFTKCVAHAVESLTQHSYFVYTRAAAHQAGSNDREHRGQQ